MKSILSYIKEIGPILVVPLLFHLLNPFNLATQFGYLTVGALFIFKKKSLLKGLDKEALWIFLFSICYTLFDALGPNKGPQYLVIQAIFPVAFYIIGKQLVVGRMKQIHATYLLVILGIVVGLSGILSVTKTLLTVGFTAQERSIPDFWTGVEMTATGVAGQIIYLLVLPGILLTAKNTIKRKALIALGVLYVITLLCSFRLGSRTCIAITLIAILVGYIQTLFSQTTVQNIRLVFFTILTVFLFLKFFPINLEASYLSTLGERLQDKNASSISTAGNRTGLWQEAMDNMVEHPLGWDRGHLAHNTWLDIARIAGVIPLILFIITNLLCLNNLRRFFSLKAKNVVLTTTFSLYFMASFLFLFGEPVILGNFYFITFFFLLMGVLKKSLVLFR